MTQPKPPTLAQQLRTLPRHVPVTFQQYSGIWYARWELQGVPYARCLGADVDGQITRFLAQRTHLAQYAPAQPLPKYSRAQEEPTECGHTGLVIWCPMCRERMIERGVVRVARREKTA